MSDSTMRSHYRRSINERTSPMRAVIARVKHSSEAGMATAEYAIATLAAAGFAGLLLVIMRSDEVRAFLMNIISQALSIGG